LNDVGDQDPCAKLYEVLQDSRNALQVERATEALQLIGGPKAVQAVADLNMRQLLNDQFFKPIREADEKGQELLGLARSQTERAYNHTLTTAKVVLGLGIGLSLIFMLLIFKDQFGVGAAAVPQPATVQATPAEGQEQVPATPAAEQEQVPASTSNTPLVAGFVFSCMTAIAGLLMPYFWDPVKTVYKANAESVKLVAGLHGYLSRLRLLGLGYAEAFTNKEWAVERLVFMERINTAAGAALKETILGLNDLGAWPVEAAVGPVQVPDLSGKLLKDAQALAKGYGLETVADALSAESTLPALTVVSQFPPAKTQVAVGSTVTVAISQGKSQ
jgi:hypothetical protein